MFFMKEIILEYTHEFVTDQWARNRGEEVIIPEKFNQPGYDRIYNGEEFQIKFNSVDAIREHSIKISRY